MIDRPNVLISWSGKRSRYVAETLREWLPLVLQSTKPWMSETDIEKGARWVDEMGKAIEGIRIGVICLSPENLNAPWILFESGALSKTVDPRSRVCTYLLGDLRPQDVEQPLGMFQASRATKEDTKKLLRSINHALEQSIPETNLDVVFERMWPHMETKLNGMPEPDKVVKARRDTEEMVAEILEFERAADKKRREATFIDELEPVMRELAPILNEMRPLFGEVLAAVRKARAAQATQAVHSADAMIQSDNVNATSKTASTR